MPRPARRSPRAGARCRPTSSARSASARAARPIATRRSSSASSRAIASASARVVARRHERRRVRRSRRRRSRGCPRRRRASRSRTPRRAPSRSSRRRAPARRTASRTRARASRTSFVTIPSTSIPSSSKRMPRVQEAVLERVGADQPQPRAGAPADLRPGAQQHRQALARVVAADEDDRGARGRSASACSGIDDAVRDDLEPGRRASARPTRPPCARRRSARRSGRSGSPRPASPTRIQPRSPAACQVRDDRALRERERRDADRRRHRLVQVDDVEALLAQHVADAADRARREDDVRQRAVRRARRPSGRPGSISGGRSPWRPVRGWRRRVSRPGRVVAHQDLHLVAARAQRGRLVLGVLDDAAPVRPRERHDDADLHAYAAASAGASRSMPALEHVVGDREREPRPAGAARAEALARRERDALLGEQPLGGQAARAAAARRRRCPRRRAARAARPTSRSRRRS